MSRSTTQKLQAIADYFALGTIRQRERAMGTNDNYFVTTDQGEFLLKIIVNTTLEDIANGLPFLQRLEAYHFPAAYYIRAAGSSIYQSDDCIGVALPRLSGEMPELTEQVCRAIGINLARLHLIPHAGLPPKWNWLEQGYLPQTIQQVTQQFGAETIPETLKEFAMIQDFQPDTFPQSIIHADLDGSNCLFDGNRLVAFIDWQDVGVGASILDFAMAVLGFCFHEEEIPIYHATFDPALYTAFYEGYTAIRPLSEHEEAHIDPALKYVGLTQPVWAMSVWDQYHPGQKLIETTRLYWAFGLDTLKLPTFTKGQKKS
ncbi:MAG: phosphotransferase [Chloroflexota bacterium]|nr:phosphotransferase [Chloroflexota bacterium]